MVIALAAQTGVMNFWMGTTLEVTSLTNRGTSDHALWTLHDNLNHDTGVNLKRRFQVCLLIYEMMCTNQLLLFVLFSNIVHDFGNVVSSHWNRLMLALRLPLSLLLHTLQQHHSWRAHPYLLQICALIVFAVLGPCLLHSPTLDQLFRQFWCGSCCRCWLGPCWGSCCGSC